MRTYVFAFPLLVAACANAPDRHGPPPGSPPPQEQPGRSGPGGGRLFVSPMGEPFRGPDGEARWFAAADTDHDGALTLPEMLADAQRFFVTLDQRGDGEIDPEDLDRYEKQILPEVRVAGGPGGGPRGGSGGSRPGGRPGGDGPEGPPRGNREGRTNDARQGAGRFAYLDYPEPVIAADLNFNRGISPAEFASAARTRFAALDRNHDGRLTRGELPAVVTRPERR